MNPNKFSKLPQLRDVAKSGIAIAILTTAMLIPVILIAWVCRKIYR